MPPAIPDAQVANSRPRMQWGRRSSGLLPPNAKKSSCGQALGANNAMARSRCCGAEIEGVVALLLTVC